jgi:branched-chain amino acid transport system substrate-binding protein
MFRRLLLLASCLALATVVVSCSGGNSKNDAIEVNLGVVQSLSGAGGVYGPSAVEGIELAIEQINKGNDGVAFEDQVLDDKSTVEGGLAAYESLKEKDVDLIVGPSLSNVGAEVLKYAQANSIPAVSPITTGSGTARIGNYVFRIALAEEVSLPALVKYVNGSTPIRTAILFFDSRDNYSRTSADAMRAGVQAVGGKIAREVDLASSPDVVSVVSNEDLRSADALLMPLLVDQAIPVLKAVQTAALNKPMLGGEALASASLAEGAGSAVNGLIVASTWHPDESSALSQQFVRDYRTTFNHDPEHFAAETYTGIFVIQDAVKRAGSTDAARVRDALAATRDLDTVLGKLSINAQGDAVFEPVFQRFENGKLVLLK